MPGRSQAARNEVIVILLALLAGCMQSKPLPDLGDCAQYPQGSYEYGEIGFPFMRHLGQAIYQVELQRERPRRPDLADLEFVRD